jgi:hypothetical protein
MEPRAALLKSSFDLAHMVFNAVVGDLDETTARYRLPGGSVPAASGMIAHVLFGEDMMVSQASRTPTLLENRDLGASTGILRISPSMTPDWLEQDFHIDGLMRYAEAVFARTAEFLESASAADMDRPMKSPMGTELSAAEFLGAFGIVHIAQHTGEVSTLKGAQGLKGLPF